MKRINGEVFANMRTCELKIEVELTVVSTYLGAGELLGLSEEF